LGAAVIPLPIEGGRVVNDKENFKQNPSADYLWVVAQSDNLVVAGIAPTYLLISRVNGPTVAIARLHIENAFDLNIDSLSAPKAPTAEDQSFKV
jgi:hypothetical protein